MAWRISTPLLGVDVGLTTVDTVQRWPLGTIVQASDPTYGQGEFIYLKGIGSTVAGSIVHYNDSFTTALTTTALDEPRSLAVAVGACVASRYGWYQIGGIAYIYKATALCLLKGGRFGASAGAAIAAASGNIIAGAIVAIHASVTATARPYVYAMLGRPHGPSDLS